MNDLKILNTDSNILRIFLYMDSPQIYGNLQHASRLNETGDDEYTQGQMCHLDIIAPTYHKL